MYCVLKLDIVFYEQVIYVKKNKAAAALIGVMIALTGGCVDISDRSAPARPVMASKTETTVTTTDIPDTPVTVAVSTTTVETKPFETTGDETGEPIEEIYSDFSFSEEDNAFLDECVFVGDSICSGLAHYEIIPYKNVVAQGNVAARNIFDFTFTVDGEELSLVSALVNAKPKYIVFSMGINDVNITTEEEFAENYREILQMTEGFVPDAKLIVLSITPIDASSDFTLNENIDRFNSALAKMIKDNEKWTYIDVTPELKNDLNALKTAYSSGDGIHLSPDAYYAMLYQVCRTYLGDNTDTTLPADNELTIE